MFASRRRVDGRVIYIRRAAPPCAANDLEQGVQTGHHHHHYHQFIYREMIDSDIAAFTLKRDV